MACSSICRTSIRSQASIVPHYRIKLCTSRCSGFGPPFLSFVFSVRFRAPSLEPLLLSSLCGVGVGSRALCLIFAGRPGSSIQRPDEHCNSVIRVCPRLHTGVYEYTYSYRDACRRESVIERAARAREGLTTFWPQHSWACGCSLACMAVSAFHGLPDESREPSLT